MLVTIFQLTINGILLGGIYALISIGLTLIFGVMKIVNFAYGELLMLGMYVTFWLFTLYGVDPYVSLIIATPLFFLVGVIIQSVVIQPIVKAPHISQIFATIGLSIALQNAALFFWKPDYRAIKLEYPFPYIKFSGVIISFPRLVTFFIAIAIAILLFLFLKKTFIGKALRATAQNTNAAQLMGVNIRNIYCIAFGISTTIVGMAGAILAPIYSIFPTVGELFVLVAFVVVVLGGMGSLLGAFVGGLIIGVVEAFSGFIIAPHLKGVVYFIVFVVILIIKPSGLFGLSQR
jgi:branched-chain amino acid transport system permease protein